MLSTPPAFNLSQNQTLQFKSVAKISVGTEIRISKFFPTRSSLVNEPCALSFGARSVSTLPFAACQLLFFDFPKISFRHRRKLFAAAKFLFKKISRRLSRLFFSFVTLSRRSLSVSTGEGGHYAGRPRSSSFLWKVFCFF